MVLPIIQQNPATAVMRDLQALSSAQTAQKAQEVQIPGLKAESDMTVQKAKEFLAQSGIETRKALREKEKLAAEEYTSLWAQDYRKSEAESETLLNREDMSPAAVRERNAKRRAETASSLYTAMFNEQAVEDDALIQSEIDAKKHKNYQAHVEYLDALDAQQRDAIYGEMSALESLEGDQYYLAAMKWNKANPNSPEQFTGDKDADLGAVKSLKRWALVDRDFAQSVSLAQAKAASSNKLSSREEKKLDYMRMGFSEEDAIKIIDNKIKSEYKEGHILTTDLTKAGRPDAVTAIPLSATDTPMAAVAQTNPDEFRASPNDVTYSTEDGSVVIGTSPGVTIWDYTGYASGLDSAALWLVNKTAGLVGYTPAKKTAAARKSMDLLARELVRARANNPRYPTTEAERLLKEMSVSPSIWTGEGELRSNLVQVHESIDKAYKHSSRLARSAPELKERNKHRALAEEMRNFLDILRIPKVELMINNPPKYLTSKEDVASLPYKQLQRLTAQADSVWMDKLPRDVKKAIAARQQARK